MPTELQFAMNENCRVFISGSNGNLGSALVQRLKAASNIEVISLERDLEDSYIRDILIHDNQSFSGRKFLVHCGWDVSNRKLKAQLKSVAETELLASLCKSRGINMIFLSSASASLKSSSNYGSAKYIAENYVIESGGLVLRPGLILFDPPRGLQLKIEKLSKLIFRIKIYPDILLSTIRLDKLVSDIEDMIHKPSNNIGIYELCNDFVYINSLNDPVFKRKNQVSIYIPIQFMKAFLQLGALFSKKLGSLYDSVQSVYVQ